MDETLIIKNFGPIKSVELKLRRFNILIGEQATGKSTVAKVLAVCRYFSYIIGNVNILEEAFLSGLNAWGLSEAVNEDSFIHYESSDYLLNVKNVTRIETDDSNGFGEQIERSYFQPFLTPKSERFSHLLNEFDKIKPKINQDYGYFDYEWRIPTSFFQNDVAAVMDNPFYIPTERGLQSVFSLGKNSIQNISDSLFNQFARLDEIARLFKKTTTIQPLSIEYKNENGSGLVKKDTDNNYYNLANAASGYQSTIPVVLSVEYYSTARRKNKTFIIEEPELNLFPSAQNRLMTYLAERATSFGHQLMLTTHSPYILTSLNNLMYAYQVGEEHAEEVNKVIDKKYWVNPDDVSAYRLMTNGTAKSIIDEELRQIDAGELDEISRTVNAIWDKISDIRFSSINEN